MKNFQELRSKIPSEAQKESHEMAERMKAETRGTCTHGVKLINVCVDYLRERFPQLLKPASTLEPTKPAPISEDTVRKLVEALRESAKIVHVGRFHQWRELSKCIERECRKVTELLSTPELAPYREER